MASGLVHDELGDELVRCGWQLEYHVNAKGGRGTSRGSEAEHACREASHGEFFAAEGLRNVLGQEDVGLGGRDASCRWDHACEVFGGSQHLNLPARCHNCLNQIGRHRSTMEWSRKYGAGLEYRGCRSQNHRC